MPNGFPCFPVVKFHTFLASQLWVGARSLKYDGSYFILRNGRTFAVDLTGGEGLVVLVVKFETTEFTGSDRGRGS